MKILFCTNAFETVSNGPAKFAHLLLHLQEQNPLYEVRVLTEDIHSDHSDQIYSIQLNIPTILRPLGMFIRMFQYHSKAMRLRKKEYAFDYLIYNNSIVGMWSALRFKHTIGFINDDNNASVSWRHAWVPWRFNRRHIFFLAEKFACYVLPKIVVNSDYLKQLITEKYHVNNEKVIRLYKSVEIIPEQSVRNNPVPVILFVKNDYVRGGLFTLIDALYTAPIHTHLIIIGPPESAGDEIVQYATGGNFTLAFMGIQPQDIVYEQMRHADIFCVPSHREALGVANIEAMYLGCPVVTTNAGGIPEVMDYGKNGWMVKPNDPVALRKAIVECLQNARERQNRSQNAGKFIQRFDIPTLFMNFIRLFPLDEPD